MNGLQPRGARVPGLQENQGRKTEVQAHRARMQRLAVLFHVVAPEVEADHVPQSPEPSSGRLPWLWGWIGGGGEAGQYEWLEDAEQLP